MAAGGKASSSASSSSSSSSSSASAASLDRKLQAVTNTMESIQGLSSWCLENKRHHAAIARRWIHWMRRSGFAHRLNLFYLANDVIQNCKRKNAIIFRDTFAEVLPEAAALVNDPSVSKSIERIFKIWEDRNVYPEETVTVLKEALSSTFKSQKQPKETPSKQPTKSWKKSQTSTNPKAALKSKIVAEFRPQSLVDELLSHKHSEDQIELKEKQLSTMRVDVCSTETLKCLKDKTGGKKFSKEFEEASAKLEEFVNSLDKQVKDGPSLTEVLENAGIFYEAQYKEVKVVANAYKTFANRVSNLKKKLDQLKATLPDPEESPVPSPSMDAPSPTGSESPFPGMGEEDATPSPKAAVTAAAAVVKSPSPELATDNRDVEDMELSDVEEEAPKIIVEERKEKPAASSPNPAKMAESVPRASPLTAAAPAAAAATTSGAPPAAAPVLAPPAVTPPAPKPSSQAPLPSSPALGLPNLANVDLAKISSILSSLTSVMKNTGVSPASRPSPSTPTSPTGLMGGLKAPATGPLAASPSPLASIFSKVEITPESILSALSKSQAQAAPGLQGLSSFLQSVAGNSGQPSETAPQSSSPAPTNTPAASGKGRAVLSTTQPFMPHSLSYSPNSSSSSAEVSSTSVHKMPSGHGPGLSGPSFKPPINSLGFASAQAPSPSLRPVETPTPQSSEVSETKVEPEPTSPSLEMKIHNFLKGNPGFSGLNLNIPILSGLGSSGLPPESHPSSSPDFGRGPTSTSMDSIDGTPVRDERSGTPTQDEMMDKPSSSNVDTMSLLSKIISPGSSTPSSTRSPLQSRDDGYPQELPNSGYRPFGLSRDSPAGMYKPPPEGLELPSSLMDSPQEKFYPDTSFQEDEDYRDFDYPGPPPSALMNLEKQPAKSILKSGKLCDPSEYPAGMSGYRQRPSGFGLKAPFGQPGRPLHDQSDGCDPLPSSGIYGSYGLRGNDSGSDASPTPSKNDAFFPPDSNHSSLPPSGQQPHSGLLQKPYPDSPHVAPQRSLFSPQNALVSPTGRLPPSNAEKSILSAISATSTMEFKNMLKNASRKPSEEGKHFGQGPKGGASDLPGLSPGGGDPQKQPEEHFRIETRVSSSCLDLPDSTEEKGAPIETLGYHNAAVRGMSGEPIQTVESIRLLGKGGRGHGREASRAGWFEMSGAGSSFDRGPSGTTEMPPLGSGGGAGGVSSFQSQYKDRLGSFQESVGNFRAGGFAAPFDRHVPPPPLEHGASFPRDQLGPPPSGPQPLPPKELSTLFARDHSVPPPRMPAVDRASPFSKEASSPLTLPRGVPPPPPPPLERSGVPFPSQPPPPLPVEHGGVRPFSNPPPTPGDLGLPFPAPPMASEHGALHQGTMKERFSLPPGAPRDPGAQPQCDHSGQPLGRARDGLGIAALARDGLGSGLSVGSSVSAQRNGTNRGGLGLRNQRPDFRPREFFLNRDPFNSLKRPRPPFARGPPFFVPKRPFFPPRY
ncbi:regulation of nuclear pre-mRNA domain-containing protein 2 isoform X1 [Protobothrops mucrosquamatus]|uniref:regulation of nuclear pre-mRNA domain-containing protein 2 isoform X1 n=1 Tax=Protobothrops mucrosquamatus TaxID=103944 RepID=UPI000775A82A|nr:regulation of nuclear pre-mRNA domain-containing protein 2 isoform X1 [Protobothrops mucrosquamatus]